MTNDFYGERGQAIGKVAKAYEETLGRMITRSIVEDIGYYIDRGIESGLFVKAFEVAADKGRGWRYIRGILQNCLEDKILTAHDWDWRVKYKKGLTDIKREYGELDEATLCMVLMVTVFKEDVLETQRDLERYLAQMADNASQ